MYLFPKGSPAAGTTWVPPKELCAHLLPLAFYTRKPSYAQQGRTLAIQLLSWEFFWSQTLSSSRRGIWRCQHGVLCGSGGIGFPAVLAGASPAPAGDATSPPVIACPGVCGYVLGAV